MGEPTKSYYAIITADVRYDDSLPANAKLLYGELTCLCNEKGYCWASNAYFANLYNVSKVTVSRWIAQLKERGYIKIDLKKKDDTTLEQVRLISIVNTPYQKCYTPLNKNDKDNTTSMNNKKRIDIYSFADGHSDTFKEAWYGFVEMRKAKKKPLTDRAVKSIFKNLSKYASDDETQAKILDESTVHCWAGVFPLKENDDNKHNASKPKKQPTQADYDEWIKEFEQDEVKQG